MSRVRRAHRLPYRMPLVLGNLTVGQAELILLLIGEEVAPLWTPRRANAKRLAALMTLLMAFNWLFALLFSVLIPFVGIPFAVFLIVIPLVVRASQRRFQRIEDEVSAEIAAVRGVAPVQPVPGRPESRSEPPGLATDPAEEEEEEEGLAVDR